MALSIHIRYLVLLIGLLSFASEVKTENDPWHLEDTLTYWYNKHYLDYMHNCSYADEGKRDTLNTLVLELLEKDSMPTSPSYYYSFVHKFITIVHSTGPLCAATFNLRCTPAGICDCVNLRFESGEEIRSIRKNGVCLLEPGSSCPPPMNFTGSKILKKFQRNIECDQETECRLKRSNALCTDFSQDCVCKHEVNLNQLFKNLSNVETSLTAKNTLDYKASCSPDVEALREYMMNVLMEFLTDLTIEKISLLTYGLNDLDGIRKTFCNKEKNLQCNSNGICDCAQRDWKGLRLRSKFQDGSCRLTPNSPCSTGITGMNQNQCELGSECVFRYDGITHCSGLSSSSQILSKLGGDKENSVLDLLCVCSNVTQKVETVDRINLPVVHSSSSFIQTPNSFLITCSLCFFGFGLDTMKY